MARLRARFYRTAAGNEPVREWLKELSEEDRRAVGYDIYTVQVGWPLGMPLVRPMGGGLHEVRSDIRDGIARVMFVVVQGDTLVLLHGFIKKTQRTAQRDLQIARARAREVLASQKDPPP